MNAQKKVIASIIIISKNEGHYLKQTVEHIRAVRTETPYEIIVVDDGSNDNSSRFLLNIDDSRVSRIGTKGLGPAGARNRGALYAQGNILVFLDAHMIPSKGWLDTLVNSFKNPQYSVLAPALGGFSHSHPDVYGLVFNKQLMPCWVTEPINEITPVPLVGGAGLAIRSETFKEINGFDTDFRIIGLEDIDLCMRLWLQGYTIHLNPQVRLLHKFSRQKSYPVLNRNLAYNHLRLALKLFNEDRIARVIDINQKTENLGNLMIDLFNSDVLTQRQTLKEKCKYNDDWFFSHFNMDTI